MVNFICIKLYILHISSLFFFLGWRLTTSNGSGGGKQRNFAEMYVFCRSKLLRRQRGKGKRRSATYSFSHLFSFLNESGIEDDDFTSGHNQNSNSYFSLEHPAYYPQSHTDPNYPLH